MYMYIVRTMHNVQENLICFSFPFPIHAHVPSKCNEHMHMHMYIVASKNACCICLLHTFSPPHAGQKCNLQLYVMAYTGGSINALTKHPPFIELTVGGKVGLVQLQIVTGLEFALNKGDMWTIDLTDFGFTDKCIRKRDVDRIAVVEGGTDGWLIDTIVTFLLDEDGSFSLLSSDIDVDVWIDGNSGEERKRFDLTLD